MATKNRDKDEPTSRFWSKLTLMSEITTIMSNNLPSKAALLKVIDSVREIIPFSSAKLYFCKHDGADYGEELTIGPPIDPAKFLLSDPAEKISVWVASLNQPLMINNDAEYSRLAGSGFGSLLAVPLKINNKAIGLLCLAHTDIGFFREQDVKLLAMLGQQFAIAHERAVHLQELEKRNEELEKAQKLLRLAQERLINDERLQAVMELSATINHEINNPLSVIVGNIQCLLFIEKGLDEKVINRLRRIEVEAMKIAEINHRLLEIDDLVSQTYVNDGTKIKMLKINESASGVVQ